ncbi:hypothetical protein EV360DRAFT_75388 [Lentinula raphanica]|nr:hypothetical protein EV360DRAFT_75388 [Lentinula raphanica]
MPLKKGKRKAENFGKFYEPKSKRAKDHPPLEESPPLEDRTNFEDTEDTSSDVQSLDTLLSELSEEGDVPILKTNSDLLSWLKSGQQELKNLCQAATQQPEKRYHTNYLGEQPSQQTQERMQAAKRKEAVNNAKAKRKPTKITNFFFKSTPALHKVQTAASTVDLTRSVSPCNPSFRGHSQSSVTELNDENNMTLVRTLVRALVRTLVRALVRTLVRALIRALSSHSPDEDNSLRDPFGVQALVQENVITDCFKDNSVVETEEINMSSSAREEEGLDSLDITLCMDGPIDPPLSPSHSATTATSLSGAIPFAYASNTFLPRLPLGLSNPGPLEIPTPERTRTLQAPSK